MWVVFGEILHVFLDFFSIWLKTHDLPLFLLYETDGLKDYFDDPIVFLLVVLVQPEIVHHHEHPLCPSSPNHVEERSNWDKDGKGTDNLTFPLLSLLIEIGTLTAIMLVLVACLAFPSAVFLANIFLHKLVLHAMTQWLASLSWRHFPFWSWYPSLQAEQLLGNKQL